MFESLDLQHRYTSHYNPKKRTVTIKKLKKQYFNHRSSFQHVSIFRVTAKIHNTLQPKNAGSYKKKTENNISTTDRVLACLNIQSYSTSYIRIKHAVTAVTAKQLKVDIFRVTAPKASRERGYRSWLLQLQQNAARWRVSWRSSKSS